MHGMQTRSSDENSVCLSVCLSNALFVTKRKKVVPAFLYRMKDHLPQFSDKKNGWWRATPLPGILGEPAPRGANSPILNRYSLVTPSEKSSINANRPRKSTTRFPRWSSYVVSERHGGAQKRRFQCKIAQVLCETVCHKVVMHSLA